MEQKNLTGLPPSLSPSGFDGSAGSDDVERLKQLINSLEECSWGELPHAVQQSLHGLEGLRRLVGAITILLIDYGGATPWGTCDSVEETAPELYREFGYSSVLALCEENQHSEIPDQSAVFQDLFERFNLQYFAGSLTDYKILVVYDVWYWETERCGYPAGFPPAFEASGFIDFSARQIFIRYLAHHPCGSAMEETLIHEMAHAATGGDHGLAWKAEMARLKQLGAPVSRVVFDEPAGG
jgi:hypothetical protein